jgi:hypothetical protein
MSSQAFSEFTSVVGDVSSLLTILGLGSGIGMASVYFSEFPLPRARILILDALLKELEESEDAIEMLEDLRELSAFRAVQPRKLTNPVREIDSTS